MISKFRVWDKTTNQMRGCYGFNEMEQEVYVCSVADDEFNGRPKTVHALKRSFDEVVIMQSTGLKDKNGVEIFEGDILYFEPYETHSNDRVVEHIDGAYHGRLIRNGYSKLLAECVYETKVIGNIYENPELLEVVG